MNDNDLVEGTALAMAGGENLDRFNPEERADLLDAAKATIAYVLAHATWADGWEPMATAPKDKMILVYGRPRDCEGLKFTAPGIHAAYWDEMDGSYCLDGATWHGPFIEPTHWMPLPDPPEASRKV